MSDFLLLASLSQKSFEKHCLKKSEHEEVQALWLLEPFTPVSTCSSIEQLPPGSVAACPSSVCRLLHAAPVLPGITQTSRSAPAQPGCWLPPDARSLPALSLPASRWITDCPPAMLLRRPQGAGVRCDYKRPGCVPRPTRACRENHVDTRMPLRWH